MNTTTTNTCNKSIRDSQRYLYIPSEDAYLYNYRRRLAKSNRQEAIEEMEEFYEEWN